MAPPRGSGVDSGQRRVSAAQRGQVHGEADDPRGRRRPGGLPRDRPRPAGALRRRLPRRCGPRPVPRRSRCSTELALRDRAGRAGRLRPADAGDDRHRAARPGPRARRPTPSCCCSRRTPTPTSPSGRSTTSASTTTCSSRGTRPRSGSTPSSTTCSATGDGTTPTRPPRCASSDTGGPTRSHEVKMFLARNHVPYRWLDVERDDEARQLVELAGPAPTTCRWCWCPTATTLRAPDDARSWPTRSGCGPAPSSRSTTCASSAAARPGWPPRCTPRPRGCAPSSSSATPPAGRPARARRSRTTWASPRACPAPTSPTGPSRRPRRFGAETVLARDVVGLRAARAGPGGPARRRRRDRGAGRAHRHRGLLPPARGAPASTR